MQIWCKQTKWPFHCLRPQHLKFRMLHNGFHHLYIKMRLRRANYGIVMDPKLIALLCKSDAKKLPLLVPEASTSWFISLPRFLPSLPPSVYRGVTDNNSPPPYCVPPALCLQGGVCQQFRPPPPIVVDVPSNNWKNTPYKSNKGHPQQKQQGY